MKIAVVGSRKMSRYGQEVIDQLIKSCKFILKKNELVTIRVSGCNGEVIRKCQKMKIQLTIFSGDNFQKINDELANYADRLVIIEGGKKSGTLLLASNFIERGKEVYCVPGRINDKGSFATNWLIKQGAIPVVDLDDLTVGLQ